jgi:sugar O-acyltransferase (sialic acid O-acetyltransferase NeuD family)
MIDLATEHEHMYLYGAGGHSKVITEILNSLGTTVIGMFDDSPPMAKFKIMEIRDGIRLLGEGFPTLDAPLIISVGNNARRAELASLIGATYGTAIHGTAIVSQQVTIDVGTVVLHGAIIQAGTKIGAHVLINTAASIDHDNTIGDYAHISPHATLCGHVQVGEGTHIGAGAIVIPSVRIGRWCTIGAGAVVIKDVPDFATAVGNPARIIKFRKDLDIVDFPIEPASRNGEISSNLVNSSVTTPQL